MIPEEVIMRSDPGPRKKDRRRGVQVFSEASSINEHTAGCAGALPG